MTFCQGCLQVSQYWVLCLRSRRQLEQRQGANWCIPCRRHCFCFPGKKKSISRVMGAKNLKCFAKLGHRQDNDATPVQVPIASCSGPSTTEPAAKGWRRHSGRQSSSQGQMQKR